MTLEKSQVTNNTSITNDSTTENKSNKSNSSTPPKHTSTHKEQFSDSDDENDITVNIPNSFDMDSTTNNRLENIQNNTELVNLKKDMNIRFQLNNDNNLTSGTLISRSGKCGGKYKNAWNIKTADNKITSIDFDRDVASFDEIK